MKTLLAPVLVISLLGCAVYRTPTSDSVKRDVPKTFVVCVFSSCRDVCVPTKQETPTPSPTALTSNTTEQQASRLDPVVAGMGIGPIYP